MRELGTAAALALAAGIHLAVALGHGTPGAHALLLGTAGAAQALLAIAVALRPTRRSLRSTVALGTAAATAWAATRVAGDTVGAVDAAAAALALVSAGLALAVLRRPTAVGGTRPAHRSIGSAAAAGLVLAAVLVTPSLAAPHEHGDGHGKDHRDEVPRVAVFGDLFEGHGH